MLKLRPCGLVYHNVYGAFSGIVYISSFARIFVDIEVNPFAADLDSLFFIKTTGNFFWTPVLLD